MFLICISLLISDAEHSPFPRELVGHFHIFFFVLFFERHLFWFFAHFLIGLFVRLLDSFASLTSERLDSFHSQLSGVHRALP